MLKMFKQSIKILTRIAIYMYVYIYDLEVESHVLLQTDDRYNR